MPAVPKPPPRQKQPKPLTRQERLRAHTPIRAEKPINQVGARKKREKPGLDALTPIARSIWKGCVYPGCGRQGTAHHLRTKGARPGKKFDIWNVMEFCEDQNHHGWIQLNPVLSHRLADLADAAWHEERRFLGRKEVAEVIDQWIRSTGISTSAG